MSTETLKTSEEWNKEIPKDMLVILDPDGWDRSNWEHSWSKEKITKKEFVKRISNSTCEWKGDGTLGWLSNWEKE